MSEEQARDMIAELGLMPEQVETFYKLAGDAEAKLQLELLQGYIDDLPDDVQTTITQQILLGDYQGAVATVQAYANRNPAWLAIQLETGLAEEQIRRLRAKILGLSNSLASVFDIGGLSVAAAGYAAPAAATTRGVPMGRATVAPVNVHVHTAVIGDRYDVQRVIGRAVRGAVRLSGVRK